MATAPAAIIDALNSLLEAEQGSIFRLMGDGSPYVGRASMDVRRRLSEMARTSHAHCRELYDKIESLGGDPRPRGLRPDEQYLSYLSIKFLLPKLVTEKKLILQRYENTVRAVGKASDDVNGLLARHVADHRAELAALERAAAETLPAAARA